MLTPTCSLPHCTRPVHNPGDPASLLCGTCLGLEDDDGRPTWQIVYASDPARFDSLPSIIDELFEQAFPRFVELVLDPTLTPRKCTKCGESFPPTSTYFDRRCKDGDSPDSLMSACKTCRRAYDEARRARVFSQSRCKVSTGKGTKISVCERCGMRLKPWEHHLCGACVIEDQRKLAEAKSECVARKGKAGAGGHGRHLLFTEHEKEQIGKMLTEGLNCTEIADRLGRPKSSIRRLALQLHGRRTQMRYLTEEEFSKVRCLLAQGVAITKIARDMERSYGTIYDVARRIRKVDKAVEESGGIGDGVVALGYGRWRGRKG